MIDDAVGDVREAFHDAIGELRERRVGSCGESQSLVGEGALHVIQLADELEAHRINEDPLGDPLGGVGRVGLRQQSIHTQPALLFVGSVALGTMPLEEWADHRLEHLRIHIHAGRINTGATPGERSE